MGDLQVYPDKGTVSFSAGLHGWAFTLTTFAKMYAAKFGTDETKMMEKLWGDNFFDPATKKWTKKATDSKTCLRGAFVWFLFSGWKGFFSSLWSCLLVVSFARARAPRGPFSTP